MSPCIEGFVDPIPSPEPVESEREIIADEQANRRPINNREDFQKLFEGWPSSSIGQWRTEELVGPEGCYRLDERQ
jgi:hypothetical protein